MSRRWWVVLLCAVALVVAPIAYAARPAGTSDVSADELARRVQASSGVGWSGSVQSSGSLQLPSNDSFATLGDLLGQTNDLRVWWRSDQDWRVDRVRSTGETDLFRQGRGQVSWVFESGQATFSPVSTIRLPDASDVLPATLGRTLLQGAQSSELARLPVRRVAGIDAVGLRLTPSDPASTVARVDLWADPATGLPLRLELYGAAPQPVLTTAVTDVTIAVPEQSTTRFVLSDGVKVAYEESTDVAAAANALDFVDLPTTLAGLTTRDGANPGAVAVYGQGPTTMIVVPLRGTVARPLRDQLQSSGTAQRTSVGTLAPVGPIGVLLTQFPGRGGGFLIAGTVTPETLRQAANSLRRLT